MKFHKRPMDDHEVSFAMSQATALTVCNCWDFSACNCPAIPTHQIQLDQTTQGKTTSSLQADFN